MDPACCFSCPRQQPVVVTAVCVGNGISEMGLEVSGEVDERYSVEKSTDAACKYLRSAYNKYGSWVNTAASYNAGMGAE